MSRQILLHDTFERCASFINFFECVMGSNTTITSWNLWSDMLQSHLYKYSLFLSTLNNLMVLIWTVCLVPFSYKFWSSYATGYIPQKKRSWQIFWEDVWITINCSYSRLEVSFHTWFIVMMDSDSDCCH